MDNTASFFVEIRPPEQENPRFPSLVEAYIAKVEPQQCGTLVKRLSRELNLTQDSVDLSHLKRVKRTELESFSLEETPSHQLASNSLSLESAEIQEPSDKRQKMTYPVHLEVLLGAVDVLDCIYVGNTIENIKKNFDLSAVTKQMVPGRVADSEEEWKEFHARWPTTFYPNKTKEYREQELKLSDEEVRLMKHGMEEAINDSLQSGNSGANTGAVVMSPDTGKVVARASVERDEQKLTDSNPNPLATSIVLAIQGVSRLERDSAVSQGMGSESFQKGQYLCTGYDVYTTLEPTVFEAMALVHSRVRRVVFGCSAKSHLGGLGKMSVHHLPGTNHNYRAFICQAGSDLADRCRRLLEDHEGP